MADYYTVLQRAVAALPENTGAGRRAIYDKARAALVRQLEGIQPPLPAAEIAKQRLSLEEAVRRLEAEVARAAVARPSAPPPEPRREPPRPPAPRPESPRTEPPRAEPAETPDAPKADAPRPPRPEVSRPDAVEASRPVRPEPAKPEPAKPEPAKPAPRVEAPMRAEPAAGPRADATPPPARGAAPPLDGMRRDDGEAAASRADTPRISARRTGEPAIDAAPAAPVPGAARPAAPSPAFPRADVRGKPADDVMPPLSDDPGDEGEPEEDKGRSREERQARKEKRRLARLGRADGTTEPDEAAVPPVVPPVAPATARPLDEPDAATGETDFDETANDERPDEDASWLDVPADTPPLRLPPKRRRNYGPLIAALVVLVLVAGGAALAYVYRDALLSQVEQMVAEEPAAPAKRAATPAQSNGEPLVAKDEDRLPAATPQNGTTPADTRAVTTTRIVTPQTTPTSDPGVPADGDAATPPATEAAPTDETAGATDDTAPAPETAPTPEAAGMTGPSRGILYEEGETAGAKGAALRGDVKWEMVRESIGGAPPEPIVRATIAVPERQATTTIIFRRNRDDALPASHLIEVAFELPPEFPGGGISNLPGLIMKVTENARGDALIGASARVSDGLFWIALSSSETDEQRNLELLRDRGWIDLPMLYDNGRRAILTVEKGSDGAEAINQAISAWESEPRN